MDRESDRSLDALLSLDGETFVIDEAGNHWVKFEVKRCEASPGRPQGVRYSLTLHGRDGKRLVGFDNAHSVGNGSPAGKRTVFDHMHRLRTIRPYDYADAAALLADFWAVVESVLAERGVKP